MSSVRPLRNTLPTRHRAIRCEPLEQRLLMTALPADHLFSSNPAAYVKFYLDFGGEIAMNWGKNDNHSVPATPAYDLDGDVSTFSNSELTNITDIWSRVAEKFSPFNVDVTTIDPGNLGDRHVVKAVIGGDNVWLGKPAGGVSQWGGFTNNESNIVWIWPSSLSFNDKYISEATAHEIGHTLGLQHHSTLTYPSDGPALIVDQEYDPGGTNIAPIMGDSYDSVRGLWDYGQYSYHDSDDRLQPGAGDQDDLTIITSANNGFGYRADDHGDTIGSAATMAAPNLNQRTGAGIIEQPGDVDYFSFNTTGGNATIHANVAASGPMLHLQAQVYNSAGTIISSSATTSLSQDFNVTGLVNGNYYVAIRGFDGANHLPWDIGQYTVSVDLNQQVDNSLATAIPVVSGFQGPFDGLARFNNFVGAADLDDFYVFTTDGAPGNFKAVIFGMTADADLYLIRDYNNNRVIDSGDVIAASLNSGPANDAFGYTSDVPLLAYTTYYVQIHRFSGDTNYFLDMSTDYAGESMATARNLGDFTGKQDYNDFVFTNADPNDFYKLNFLVDSGLFSVPILNIHMDQLRADADVELIQDLNNNGQVDPGETIASSRLGGTSAENIHVTLDSGTYYIHVIPYNGASTNYHLNVEADYAGPGLHLTRTIDATGLSVVSDYVGTTDSADAYYLDSPAGKLSVTQTGPHLLQLVHDVNQNTVIDPGEIVAAGHSIDYNIPVADGYFLKVIPDPVEIPTDGNYTLYVLHDLNTNGSPAPGNAPNLGTPGPAGLDIPGFVGRPNNRQSNSYHPDDYVKVHLATTRYVYATVGGMSGGDAELELAQDANGNGKIDSAEVLGSSQRNFLTNEFIGRILPAGDYLFHVYAAMADGSVPTVGYSTNYTLHVATTVVGDANLDGHVTGADYTLWAANFGSTANNLTFAQGDFNGDGHVTGTDYTLWATNFQSVAAAGPPMVAFAVQTAASRAPASVTSDPRLIDAAFDETVPSTTSAISPSAPPTSQRKLLYTPTARIAKWSESAATFNSAVDHLMEVPEKVGRFSRIQETLQRVFGMKRHR